MKGATLLISVILFCRLNTHWSHSSLLKANSKRCKKWFHFLSTPSLPVVRLYIFLRPTYVGTCVSAYGTYARVVVVVAPFIAISLILSKGFRSEKNARRFIIASTRYVQPPALNAKKGKRRRRRGDGRERSGYNPTVREVRTRYEHVWSECLRTRSIYTCAIESIDNRIWSLNLGKGVKERKNSAPSNMTSELWITFLAF